MASRKNGNYFPATVLERYQRMQPLSGQEICQSGIRCRELQDKIVKSRCS